MLVYDKRIRERDDWDENNDYFSGDLILIYHFLMNQDGMSPLRPL